tara:strand:+ start:7283 stop:7738 length:456 start_codon:yes stop_codon:yes gene_type:complete
MNNTLVDRFNGTWGDIAEGEFEKQFPTALRYGLNKPPLNWGVEKLPLMLRYTPDYLLPNSLIEVQGFGKNGLKVKFEKLRALDLWDQQLPVYFWLWSSARQDSLWLPLDGMWELLDRSLVTLDSYNDTRRGKAYVKIRPGDLPWESASGPI